MTVSVMRRVLRAVVLRIVAPSALLLAAASVSSSASAEDAAAYYKGKTVKIVVGFGPGGGYDAYARMIAPYLERAIGTSVIVENQPGAGSLTSLNRLYAAPPDGLLMTLANGTAAGLGQLLDQQNARYDLAKFEYYGIVSASPWVWLTKPDSKYQTPQDAMKSGEVIRWAGSGPTDGLSDGGAVTCEALQLKCKLIIGYQGTNEAALAVFRGEMDALYVSDTSANNYVKSGQAHAVANMSRERSRFFPNLPTIFEMVQMPAENAWWLDFRGDLDKLGRVMMTTPGVSADRVAFMQAKVKQVLSDPKLIAEGEKSQRYVDFIGPDVAKKTAVGLVGNVTPEQRARIENVIIKKYH
ncbi:MAG TPA: tripartite tricarboxylate transporter substrate-binding protein [Alphaproteobacteria bacterium]|jgi:tripartite-type tricarboxylate transporter receptor subunit TctC